MKLKKLLLLGTVILSCSLSAQEGEAPTTIIQGTFIGKTIPLRDFPTVSENTGTEVKDIIIIPNNFRANEKVNQDALPLGFDQTAQKEFGGITGRALEENFIGATNTGATPPDPTGAVGPNHYVHSVNSIVNIFDKTGVLLAGPVPLGTFLGIGSNSGDPIVMYDQLADRYFVSQFGSLNNSLAIGVSETNDPTGAYNVYQYSLDAFPDYPHYSIWHNGYYLTANKGGANKVYAIERDVMLAGGANPQIIGFPLPGYVQNTNTVLSPETSNLLGTTFPADAPAYVTYLQDDGWGGAIANDHLKIWEMDIDWVTPANSTISSTPLEVPTAPFDAVFAPFGSGDVEQPGTGQKIDMIGGIISYAANYRSFGTHNSWLITFLTDVDGNDLGGIRWIELRNDAANDWTIYQEGTYAPADGNSRFMGSAAMDAAGNIGLAFNIASATLPAGIRYTGRFDGDPLGEMTITETEIIAGVGVQTFSNRFGDYSHMTMDPNNFTFWHTAEYFTANNQWASRVASFSLSGGFASDVGSSNILTPSNGLLTNSETVEISIRNFGSAPQSNIPLELRLDGNLVASETFTGTITAGSIDTFTFAQTLDLSTPGQTYSIEARTSLVGDEFIANDDATKEVTHLLANDVGALEITSPESGSGLGLATVSVNIKNFGATAQTGFDIQYSIDGGTPVVETFTGTINSEEEIVFDFATQGDFSALGSYTIVASTTLIGDQDAANDETTVNVENVLCQPTMNCSFGDGFQLVQIAEINNVSDCEGYADFTSQIANLGQDSTNSITFTTGYGDQNVQVWIDFNDDSNFTNDEVVVPNFVIAPGSAGGSYTETVDLVIPAGAAVGEHRMRAKSNWQAPVSSDPCEESSFGETEDYTANIGVLGLSDIAINNSDMVVSSTDNKQFEVLLTTSLDETIYAGIYNMLGQQLSVKTTNRNDDNGYRFTLDMSSAASGVYIIRVGTLGSTTSKSERIIVK
ncbi:MAG: hypothetical protein ACJAQ2_002213 [Vicingaceae bacterium]|jgi:hypothetical protein